MKISKKILMMFMCGLIAVGGSQLSTLVKADAASVTQSTAKQGEKWRLGIRLKLRAKRNSLYKAWRQIDLVCEDNGDLKLEKTSTIPSNLTFDDTYYIGFEKTNKHRGEKNRMPFVLDMNIGGNTDAILKKEIEDFNKAGARVTDYVIMHGKRWDDTLKFSSVNYPVKQLMTENDYTYGYKHVSKWGIEFGTENDGLYEFRRRHSKNLSDYQLS